MKKGIKNLIIYGTVTTLALAGGYSIKKHFDNKKEIKDDNNIRIEQAIVYTDGSITYLMDFPKEYGIDNSNYVETRPNDIDYIEYYDKEGNKTVVDYPIENEKVKRK